MRGDLLEELPLKILDANKSHDRLSASWKHWDAGSLAPFKSEDHRTKEADGGAVSLRRRPENPAAGGGSAGLCWCNSWSPKANESQVLMSKAAEEKYIPAI